MFLPKCSHGDRPLLERDDHGEDRGEAQGLDPASALPASLAAMALVVALLAHSRLAAPLRLEWLARRWGLFLVAFAAIGTLAWLLRPCPGGMGVPPRRRSRRRAMRAVVALVSWLSGTLAAELALRATGRYGTWLERNGAGYVSPYDARGTLPLVTLGAGRRFTMSQPEFSHEVVTNSLGLRDDERVVEKPAGVYRIVAVGDSFTMSQGAALEDAWTRVLQRDLNRLERVERVEVLCAGVPGSDPVFGLRLLEERLLAYGPDVVLLVLNGSDVMDLMTRGGFERFAPDGTVRYRSAPTWEPLFARSHLFRHLVFDYGGFDYLLIHRDDREAREAEAVSGLLEAGRRFSGLAERSGFRPLVVLHPLIQEVHPGPEGPGLLWRRAVGTQLEALGLPVCDLSPWLRARIASDALFEHYWPIDTHFTPRGYRLVAEGVAEHLAALPGFPAARE